MTLAIALALPAARLAARRLPVARACGAAAGERAAGRDAACGAGPEPGRGQDAVLEADRGDHRQGQGEHLALTPNLLVELRAARAGAQVPAEWPGPKGSAARRGELLTDLVAGDLARPAALEQGGAGLEDERLHLHGLAPHDLRDLGVREVAHLREHDRGALVLG